MKLSEFIKSKNISYSIENLNLAGTLVSELDVLDKFKNLRSLDISMNHWIKDLSPINKMKGLENLSMNNIYLKNMIDISNLKKLSHLSVQGNALTTFDVSNFKKLITLNLEYNILTEIKGLEKCKNLMMLNLAYNRFNTLSLPNYKDLVNLYLNNNKLKYLPNLSRIKKLEYISYHNNPLLYKELYNENGETDFLTLNGIVELTKKYHRERVMDEFINP